MIIVFVDIDFVAVVVVVVIGDGVVAGIAGWRRCC